MIQRAREEAYALGTVRDLVNTGIIESMAKVPELKNILPRYKEIEPKYVKMNEILTKFLDSAGISSPLEDVLKSPDVTVDELVNRLGAIKLYDELVSKYAKLNEQYILIETERNSLNEKVKNEITEKSKFSQELEVCKENLASHIEACSTHDEA